MNILDIIAKKRDKKELSKEEIDFFIKNYTNGNIADYQASSLIMAIFLNGMTKQETTYLTMAMANSGEILDLSSIGKIIVDKHSTGGVGDKVSLIILPIVASLGVPVAKMSGRGLGFTGGTVDKLESIPGYKTNIDINSFIKNVENIGISMISQTLDLAPADKKLYALRDAISCVESIPLIASSIMSKKIAGGADKIVLDVTCGHGAFMKNIDDAKALANEMIELGNLVGRETKCIITNMNQPLGNAVGNNLEVIESIEFLKGKNMPEDLKDVVFELGSEMIHLAGLGDNKKENKKKIMQSILDGSAYSKFIELVGKQEGDITYIEDTNKFPKSKYIEEVKSGKDGFIYEINAEEIGKVACELGAGRIKKEDSIEPDVGVILKAKVGSKVSENEVLAYVHANDIEKLKIAKQKITDIIKIGNNEVRKERVILDII